MLQLKWGPVRLHMYAGIILCMPPANKITLHCNAVSHWLGTYIKWSLYETGMWRLSRDHSGHGLIHMPSIFSYQRKALTNVLASRNMSWSHKLIMCGSEYSHRLCLSQWTTYFCLLGEPHSSHIAGLVVNYGISNTVVLEIPKFSTKPVIKPVACISSDNFLHALRNIRPNLTKIKCGKKMIRL